jgi:site-specific recombinase XerD
VTATSERVRAVPAHLEHILGDPEAVAAAYARHIERTGVSPATARAYSTQVRVFCRWLADQVDQDPALVFTSPFERDYACRDYRRYLLVDRGLKPKSVDDAGTALGSFFLWVGFESKPTWVRVATRSERTEPPILSDREATLWLRGCERVGQRDLAMAHLLLHGLRVAEAAAVNLGHMKLSERTGSVYVAFGKGGRPRTVPLNSEARAALGPVLLERIRATSGSGGHDPDAPLFVSKYGARWTTASIRKAMVKAGAAIERDGVRVRTNPHVGRHTAASKMVRELVDLGTVRDLLGHADMETLNKYTHSRREDRESAVEKLGYSA